MGRSVAHGSAPALRNRGWPTRASQREGWAVGRRSTPRWNQWAILGPNDSFRPAGWFTDHREYLSGSASRLQSADERISHHRTATVHSASTERAD